MCHPFLAESAESFELDVIQIFLDHKPEGVLYHKGFNNNRHIDFISFGLAHIVFMHRGSLNRIENTHFKALTDKKMNTVVTVVWRWLKTYDDAVQVK